MAEAEIEEAVKLLKNKASETLQGPSSIALSASKHHKPSYILTRSLAEMANEDPVRLQNRDCVIREETVEPVMGHLWRVYSSFARLPTFSIGLSSTRGEALDRLRERSVDPKDKSPPRYFQMPELGARVFVGDGDGSDTIFCRLFHDYFRDSKFDLDSENATIMSLYKDDRHGGLSDWIRVECWRNQRLAKVILSGTELFVDSSSFVATTVGNLGGKSSRESGSNLDYKDYTSDKSIRKPSDIVEQPRDPVPGVFRPWEGSWRSVEKPALKRSPKGSYLEKPKFTKWDYPDSLLEPSERDALQLTRFDDFVILGSLNFTRLVPPRKIVDIVRKNAFETADVIAAQLVKCAIEGSPHKGYHITAIVIFLDHKAISVREHEKELKKEQKYKAILLGVLGVLGAWRALRALRDDKKIAKLKKKEKTITLKEGGKIFALKMEDKKRISMEEDHKVKLLVGEPHVPQTSTVLLEESELGLESTAISSNFPGTKVQDDSEASSSVVLTEEDDCMSKDFMVPHEITKWIIHGDLQERALLCFFNVEGKQFEFYFEDYESMATIIGLGVPHSKVVLECGSAHVRVVEIPRENWDVVWALSNVLTPLPIPEGNVLKQENFPDILRRIANVVNPSNIVSKANNGGGGGDNAKGKAQGNVVDRKGKGKAHDHDDLGNGGDPDGDSCGARDDNDQKEREEKDGNGDENDSHDREDGKTSNDGKEVQAIVYLLLWPGGVLEEKGKKKELGEVHKVEVEEKKIELGEVHEEERVEKKRKELGEIHKVQEEEVEKKKTELEEIDEGVEKKKKKYLIALRRAFKRSENGNVVGNQQKQTTAKGAENGDVGENLEKQLEDQIFVEMVFTFTIKHEAGGPLKTIQATINNIEFQLPFNNEENYLQKRRFGWFHDKLQVAFGAMDTQVAILDPKSRKVLETFEVEEVSSQGNSKENASTNTNAYKGRAGVSLAGVTGFAEYTRTNGSEAKKSKDVQTSWKTNIKVTKGDFYITDRTILKSHQLKYLYCARSPFKVEEFEELHDDDRLKMYDRNPICQSQQVSCEGTWRPYDSKKLEAYKLEASRELGMTRIYNSELQIVEEKEQKGVQKVENNLPLCLIQKLEKVVYLNHAMSHLTSSTTSSTTRVYRLREFLDVQRNPPKFLTQGQSKEDPKWPGNDPLVDFKQ